MADKISNRDIFFNPFSKDNPVIVQSSCSSWWWQPS